MDRNPRRRLLIVVHSAKAAGAQLVALGQAQWLARDYDLVIAVGHGPLRPQFAKLGELVRAPTRVPVWGASRSRWALELARAFPDAIRFVGLARIRRIDAIVTDSTVLVAPVLAARIARIPVVVHAQEAPSTPAARRLLRFHGALATTVVAISPWIVRALGRTRARVAMIPVGIPITPSEPRSGPDDGAPTRLLVVGTLDSRKRQDLAIEALELLHARGFAARLDIVGSEPDDGYAAALREQVSRAGLEDRVRFVGHSANVREHMRRADALLVPAGEVTPLVLMEAMANGTPAVAARMGSIPDVVVDGESGLLVAPDDPTAMADAIERVATEPELAPRLARGGRARVERHFDAQRSHAALSEELACLAPAQRAGASVSSQ
jgi:glycosyltransferase involved in cell wall biosynthesis